jgi:hypothetical protein
MQTLMAITVVWEDVDQTILGMTYAGLWDTPDFRNAGLQAILMVRSVKHPVYVVTDYTQSASQPVGLLWQARDLSGMRPPNWGGGVTVTQDLFMRSLLEIFIHVYMLRHHQRNQFVASTKEEALEIIARLKRENQVS